MKIIALFLALMALAACSKPGVCRFKTRFRTPCGQPLYADSVVTNDAACQNICNYHTQTTPERECTFFPPTNVITGV